MLEVAVPEPAVLEVAAPGSAWIPGCGGRGASRITAGEHDRGAGLSQHPGRLEAKPRVTAGGNT